MIWPWWLFLRSLELSSELRLIFDSLLPDLPMKVGRHFWETLLASTPQISSKSSTISAHDSFLMSIQTSFSWFCSWFFSHSTCNGFRESNKTTRRTFPGSSATLLQWNWLHKTTIFGSWNLCLATHQAMAHTRKQGAQKEKAMLHWHYK